MRLAAVTIFLGSMLLFGVQPMLGRTLLPGFGGTASVWVVCLCAYQVMLLGGYFYAHLAGRGGWGRRLHAVFLSVSVVWALAFAAALPALSKVFGSAAYPPAEVLLWVLLAIGPPYVLLSANGSLVQAWASRGAAGAGAYRLYAVSNAGSFCGLLLYPFAVEPHVPLSWQWYGFAAGLAGYAGLVWVLSRGAGPAPGAGAPGPGPCPGAPGVRPGVNPLWVLLPASGVFLLNAVTAHLTLDVMPLPLLWAVLLGLFLLSYVIGFSSWAERNLPALAGLAFLSLSLVVAAAWGRQGGGHGFLLTLGAGLGLCLSGCLFLHAWLYSARPPKEGLTLYYLCNAAGGAVGGILASLVAPAVFRTVLEFPVCLAILLAWVMWFLMPRLKGGWRAAGLAAALAVAACGCFAFLVPHKGDRPVVHRGRGFFGTIEVLEAKARAASGEGVVREFIHGTTVHGIQALIPGRERAPTAYFTPDAGGYPVVAHPKYRSGEPMRVNIVGLGVGVMLCYARPGDYYRAYEISPEALRVAADPGLFTFVSGCPAQLDIVPGDARKGLERELAEGAEGYDVIHVDAFTGDNLPYHLSTAEAFGLYFSMLKPGGVLAVNISNWHLDLEPFMKAVGDRFGVPVLGLRTRDDFARLGFAAKFAFFCREPENLSEPPATASLIDFGRVRAMPRLPEDGRGSFVGLIKLR